MKSLSKAPRSSGPAELLVLQKRADFMAAAKARKQVRPTLVVQARRRADGTDAARVGFTCSKRVGNAVTRNRAKRRLRAVAHSILKPVARPGWDYVLIGRANATVSAPFARIEQDLRCALDALHATASQASDAQ